MYGQHYHLVTMFTSWFMYTLKKKKETPGRHSQLLQIYIEGEKKEEEEYSSNERSSWD